MLSKNSQVLMENVFNMNKGRVLDFDSKRELQSFIMERTEINIMDDTGYSSEDSMAKKLRYFVQHESDIDVSKILLALIERREKRIGRKIEFNDEFVDEHADAAQRIKEELLKMEVGATSGYSTDKERFDNELTYASNALVDLQEAIEQLLINQSYNYSKSENEINDYIRDLLSARKNYEVKDQTRHGLSLSEKDAGEVDILLRKDGKETLLIEALKLSYIDEQYISDHIQKATKNYNPLGTPTVILTYVGAKNFVDFWNKYINFLNHYDYGLTVVNSFSERPSPNPLSKEGMLILSKNDYKFPIFFLAIQLHE